MAVTNIDVASQPQVKGTSGGFNPIAIRVLVLFGVPIIGILVWLGIFAMNGGPTDTDCPRSFADIRTLETNLVRYRNMAGCLPSQEQGLEALVKRPSGDPIPTDWHALMDRRALIDPWGHPYQYRNPGKNKPDGYDVFSLGKDGVEGTEDDVYAQ